jgi:hypothetical protein
VCERWQKEIKHCVNTFVGQIDTSIDQIVGSSIYDIKISDLGVLSRRIGEDLEKIYHLRFVRTRLRHFRPLTHLHLLLCVLGTFETRQGALGSL